MKSSKYIFVPEELDIDTERERMKNENDRIPLDDPSLVDFFGYDLKADEERFDAESRQIYKDRIKLMVLKFLTKAHESGAGPIQHLKIWEEVDLSVPEAEILEALDCLQSEGWVRHVAKGWLLTEQSADWVKREGIAL